MEVALNRNSDLGTEPVIRSGWYRYEPGSTRFIPNALFYNSYILWITTFTIILLLSTSPCDYDCVSFLAYPDLSGTKGLVVIVVVVVKKWKCAFSWSVPCAQE